MPAAINVVNIRALHWWQHLRAESNISCPWAQFPIHCEESTLGVIKSRRGHENGKWTISLKQGTSTFFLKVWEIPKVWEISQNLGKFGKIWENWSKPDQGDFLRLRDARDCTPVDWNMFPIFFQEEHSERTFTRPFYNWVSIFLEKKRL